MAEDGAARPGGAGGVRGRNLTFGLREVQGRSIMVGDHGDRPSPTEAEVAKQHGVSRSVTREAVTMPGAKGPLAARPDLGTFVRPEDGWNLFDPDVLRWLLERRSSLALLRHFSELRVAVEPTACALAALHASADQRAAIPAGLERMRDAERGDDDPPDSGVAFHVAVLRASNNPFFWQFRDVVATALRTSIRFTNRLSGRPASIRDHAAVHDAISRPCTGRAGQAELDGQVRGRHPPAARVRRAHRLRVDRYQVRAVGYQPARPRAAEGCPWRAARFPVSSNGGPCASSPSSV